MFISFFEQSLLPETDDHHISEAKKSSVRLPNIKCYVPRVLAKRVYKTLHTGFHFGVILHEDTW